MRAMCSFHSERVAFQELSQSRLPNPGACLPQAVTFSSLTNFVLVWMVYKKDFLLCYTWAPWSYSSLYTNAAISSSLLPGAQGTLKC